MQPELSRGGWVAYGVIPGNSVFPTLPLINGGAGIPLSPNTLRSLLTGQDRVSSNSIELAWSPGVQEHSFVDKETVAIVIPGATTPDRVLENLYANTNWVAFCYGGVPTQGSNGVATFDAYCTSVFERNLDFNNVVVNALQTSTPRFDYRKVAAALFSRDPTWYVTQIGKAASAYVAGGLPGVLGYVGGAMASYSKRNVG